MLCTGEGGDTDDFANWAAANLRLYKTRNGLFILDGLMVITLNLYRL